MNDHKPECPRCRETLRKKIEMEDKGNIPLPETEDEGYPSMNVYQCPNCKNIEIRQ